MGIIKFNNVPSTTPGLEVETFPNYVAPEKEYQVTHVPGRNGDLVVDTKTYKNVPRSYKVSMAVEPPAVSVSGSTASFEATAERALAECKTVISSDVGKVGTTIINSATDPVENNEPYNFRAVPNGVGDRENDTLIGGTVAWNQLVKDKRTVTQSGITNSIINNVVSLNGTATAQFIMGLAAPVKNHVMFVDVKYNGTPTRYVTQNAAGYFKTSSIYKHTSSDLNAYYIVVLANETIDESLTFRVFDLTQMFGSTIADYIYSLEQATAGAGVAWFRNLFPKDYYAYNAGELISVKTEAHKMVGFNQWDEEWEQGSINDNTGEPNPSNAYSRSKNFIKIIPDTDYYFYSKTSVQVVVYEYDYNHSYIGLTVVTNLRRHITAKTQYIKIRISGGSYTLGNVCVNLYNTALNGTYEPYEEHTYPLNAGLELRGIPKLNSSNKLYYDGDIYSSDGSVIRKYGIVDLGTLDWIYTSADGQPVFQTRSVLSDMKSTNETRTVSNLLSKFVSVTWNNNRTQANYDKTISTFIKYLSIRDSSYTDVTTFKTAMSGVYLVYELATPVIESTTGLIDNVSIASFDDGADDQPVNNLAVYITAMESGSGEKSPENPYTISGFDSGVVPVSGKNLIGFPNVDFTIANMRFYSDGTAIKLSGTSTAEISSINTNFKNNLSFTLPAGVYYISANTPTGLGIYLRRYSDNVLITSLTPYAVATLTETTKVYFGIYVPNNKTVSDHNTQFNITIGETATTYEAYNGNTYTFAFGQTVYGGHFDNKGNLVVTHSIVDLSTLNWIYNSLNQAFYSPNDIGEYRGTGKIGLCEIYTVVDNVSRISDVPATNNIICGYIDSDIHRIYVRNTAYTDETAFANSMTGKHLVYKLATPITLAITSQDIPTLLGNNNIFANTGNIKALSYPKQVCPFEPAQEVDDHGTEEYVDNREVVIPVGHESKYFTAGKIYNFSWSDEAGLIKEGELNADTGVLTITDGYKIIDIGDLTWSYNASRVVFNVQITDIKTVSSGTIGNMSCSIYTVSAAISSASDAANKPDMTIFQQKDNASVFIKNSLFTDPATFKSAMHGIKLLYELADPVRTIQLTPVQVESLIGHNILISESGNISVTPRTYSTYTEKMNAISDWLHSASGYARLEDTYEPDYYRRAYYDEQTDMENIFNEAGRATLKFVCKPQRYLKSGEEPITISSGGLIQNRTKYEAYPILKVTTNNTQGSVAIGNHSITIKAGAGTDPITIDCELQDAWSGTSNKNSYIVLTDGEFPVIDPGTQTVTFDGGVQSVEVIPRWWTV
jgi:phage-related protein